MNDRRFEAWETHAGWWQDGFTDGADPEYEEQILPIVGEHLTGCRRVLDVGCGEGQLARRAGAGGSRVTGLDPIAAQVELAAARGGGPDYVRGEAVALPFATGSFDAVVACLVFEHLEEPDAAIAEVARVLEPQGRFLFLLNHPLLQAPGSGWVDDHILEEQYWRVGAYLSESVTDEEMEPGVVLPFVHRPLSRYVNAMAEHGLLVDRMLEPAPPAGFLERAPGYADAAEFPRLLVLRAVRV
ncbi:MAG: class I SAM-dependent methyltransferase [Actinomycetes bacterium]